MVAYWVARSKVNNPDQYKKYTDLVPGILQKFGGKFLARGGKAHALEGDWPECRRVIIEFPSVEAARNWWDSPEYEKPKALRRANSKGRLLLLEGV